ncbi:MAG: hypothetical protein J5523_07595 [Muribaculaceae bacterium]|nr:hypothetical protein [Muribaculaceae bacterium]
MNKTDLLFEMLEHPEQYSEEQWHEILADDECRELYAMMAKTKGAFAAENADAEVTDDMIESEWQRLSSAHHKKAEIVPLWRKIAAAAVISAILLLPTLNISRTKENSEIAITTPVKTDVKSEQATKVVNANITAEDKVPTADIATHKVFDTKQKTKRAPALLAQKKVPQHKCGENIQEKQKRIETPEIKDISTSELLETIHILSVMETNDIIITASSKNDGFILKTTNSNGPSETYMLKRSSDSTSIEIKSLK